MVLRNVLMNLSENEMLNAAAQKYGLKIGAESVVAGTNLEEMIESVKKLNAQGIEATIDNLGEFVYDEAIATKAKDEILEVIDAIQTHGLNAHISVKPSQVGLDIDIDFCYDNLREIVEHAAQYGMFVNLDMENYARLQSTLDMLQELNKVFDNVGTVMQAYLFRAKEDIERLKDYRLRIVKGAYKESAEVAYQDKLEIDINFLELVEYHLLHGKFTSIATHDHNLIAHVKQFVADHDIPNDKFEFQMLYGFRTDMQKELTKDYNFCTYVPFGKDWYGYFMRRLAERPQNINLVTKQVFNKKTNTILAVAAGAFILGRLTKRK